MITVITMEKTSVHTAWKKEMLYSSCIFIKKNHVNRKYQIMDDIVPENRHILKDSTQYTTEQVLRTFQSINSAYKVVKIPETSSCWCHTGKQNLKLQRQRITVSIWNVRSRNIGKLNIHQSSNHIKSDLNYGQRIVIKDGTIAHWHFKHQWTEMDCDWKHFQSENQTFIQNVKNREGKFCCCFYCQ